MLRFRVAWLIYRKELRETLRDRRTLVVMILLPLTLYPLLTLTFASLAASQKREEGERPSQVCMIGSPAAGLRNALLAEEKLQVAPPSCSRGDLKERSVQVLLDVPPAFERSLTSEHPDRATVLYDENDESSRLAADRVERAVASFAQERRRQVLLEHGLPQALVDETPLVRHSVTSARENGAALLAKVLPVLVIFMVVLGAFYPAIDLTAGERERGTLETLLVAPVERIEIIVGKWLATATIATITGFLNLGSMGATVGQMLRLVDSGAPLQIPWSAVGLAGLAIIPSALFFAAIFMAVASLARTYKEAQSLVMPVYLAVSLPATWAAMPGSELSLGSALIPGTGVALFVKGIISARLALVPAATALLAMLGYAAIALAVAARIYTSEETLLGESPEAAPRRRIKALFGSRLPIRPALSPAEAMTLFSIVVLLLFFVAAPLQQSNFVRGILVTQWALLLGATLLFLRTQNVDVRSALGLAVPSGSSLLAAVLMGGSAWLLVSGLVELTLARFFDVRDFAESMRRTLMSSPRPLGINLFLFAATPAICEEVLFRGAILSGLRRGLKPWGAAIACGLLFGLFHLRPLQMLPTALLGVILSWLVIASGSIIPAMVFHFLNNAAAIVLTSFGWDDAVVVSSRTGRLALACAAVAFATGLLINRKIHNRTVVSPKTIC
jgi:sodium transport system permease protein